MKKGKQPDLKPVRRKNKSLLATQVPEKVLSIAFRC